MTPRRTNRALAVAGALVLCALSPAVAVADDSTDTEQSRSPNADLRVEQYDATAFESQAAAMDPGLTQAIDRDLGLTAAEYLAQAAAAKNADDVATELSDQGVEILQTRLDDDGVTIAVASPSDVEQVEATGAAAHVGRFPDTRDERAPSPRLATGTSDEAEAGVEVPGGVLFFTHDNLCSLGFNGYDADGNARFLTAGHCIEPGLDPDFTLQWGPFVTPLSAGWDWDGSVVDLGTASQDNVRFGEGGDSALIDAVTTPVAEVTTWGGGTGSYLDGTQEVRGTVAPVLGAPVCKSGMMSGWSCGHVLSLEPGLPVLDAEDELTFVDEVRTDLCTISGDSGGPILSGPYAMGVTSASDYFEVQEGLDPCDLDLQIDRLVEEYGIPREVVEEDPQSFFGAYGYALDSADLRNVRDDFGDGFQVAVVVDAPVLAQTDQDASGIRGTLEYGTADHTVVLTIDGEDYEATVTADGTFAISAPDLETGEHEYELQAFYGPGRFSASEVTTGVLAVTEVVVPTVILAVDGGTFAGRGGITVRGTADPDAGQVVVTLAEDSLMVPVADDGTFTATFPTDPGPGSWTVTAGTMSDTGQGSTDTATVTVGLAVPVPDAPAPVGPDQSVTLTGTGYPGAEVFVAVDGLAPLTATVTASGEWSVAFTAPEAGDHQVTVTQSSNQVTSEPAIVTLTVEAASTGGTPGDTASGGTTSPPNGSVDRPVAPRTTSALASTGAGLGLAVVALGLLGTGATLVHRRRRSATR